MSTLANWLPNYKVRYGDLENPIPEENTIADYFPFIPQDQRPGQNFNVPIVVQLEHGLTADNTGTAFTLRAARDSVLKQATIDGSTLALLGNIPYDVTFKGRNGAGNGSNGGAFKSAFELKTSLMMQSMEFYRELSLLYGAGNGTTISSDIGVLQAAITGTLGAGTTAAVTRASWAPGIWNNMVGAAVDIYAADGITVRALGVTVTAVNPDFSAGVSPSVGLFLSASGVTPVATDRIVPSGWLGKTCVGLEAILQNTGTLFGISAAQYPMWKAVQFNAGGALTRAKILAIMSRLFPNGLTEGGKLFVSGATFADLAEESIGGLPTAAAAVGFASPTTGPMQRYEGNNNDLRRTGANNLQYVSPAGVVDIALHKYMKYGEAMFFPKGAGKRVGSTDITFRGEGMDWFFLELELAAGCQLRLLSNQAPFIVKPYRCAYINGIVNTTVA